MEAFRNVSIKLAYDETPVDRNLVAKSTFLRSALKLELDCVVGDAAPELNLSNLGHLWDGVTPTDGAYEFEVATELPYYLPTLEKKPEYSVVVEGLELFVCLRMVRAFCGAGYPTTDGTTYALVHRKGLESLSKNEAFRDLHPVPIRTFISSRFSAPGGSAEYAIQKNFNAWRDKLVSGIAVLIDALRTVEPETNKHLLPYPSTAAYPIFWVVPNQQMGSQFTGDMGLAVFRSMSDISKDRRPDLEKLLAAGARAAPHEVALGLARTFCHYGYFGFAIVQICVATETVLARAYTDFVFSKGVSNKTLKENRKEITFSQLLNIHLFTMREIQKLDGWQGIVGTLNWTRRNRNDVVHEGSLENPVTADQVNKAIDKAVQLIQFVTS